MNYLSNNFKYNFINFYIRGKEKFYIIDNINSSSNNIPFNNEYAISSFMTGFISNFKTMLVPKDYQDYIGVQRSSISYNNNLLKVNNIVSFIPKTISEVWIKNRLSFFLFYDFIIIFRHIVLLLMEIFTYF